MNYPLKQLWALKNNLSAGFKLAIGYKVSRHDFSYSLDQGLWLLVLLAGLNLLVGYVVTEAPVTFYRYGINDLSATYLADFIILILVARLACASVIETASLLIANLAVSATIFSVIRLVYALQEDSVGANDSVLLFFIIFWQFFITLRMLRLYLPLKALKAYALSALNIALLLCVSIWVFPKAELWYSDEPDTEQVYSAVWDLDVETLFYAQPQRMNEALNRMVEHRPNMTDLYLLALGGDGLENVFLNEVRYVQALFDQKFDTRDRSMVLVNNLETQQQYPLANQHNLNAALAAIGARMNPKEDILFLFMTSHGSKDYRFSVNFGPMSMNSLTPQGVRKALDDSGILWRVLLVSSCYSGGFIKSLEGPNTLVITAAAKDRTSFGCGATSEFTDFGEAYFKKGLANQTDFIEAFTIAGEWVQHKEQLQKQTPSKPQISIGEAIRPKLIEYMQERKMRAQ